MSTNTLVKRILVLAANPKQTSRLRLDEEVRDIKEGLQRSHKRDKFILQQEWAVRPRDIRRAILDFRPHIIHFSGHGLKEVGLAFENETGQTQLVTGEALAGLFGQCSKQVECVLLNACYSENQAEAIAKHVNYVIGMNAPIGDKAAVEFAVGFYDALAAYDPQYDSGTAVDFAFNIARNAIQLAGVSGDSIPVIKNNSVIKKNINLSEVDKPTVNEPRIYSNFIPILRKPIFFMGTTLLAIVLASPFLGKLNHPSVPSQPSPAKSSTTTVNSTMYPTAQLIAQDFYNMGREKSNNKQYKEAVADFTAAININPKYADAYYKRGNAYSDLGDKKAAIADYTEAIRINPISPNCACTYKQRGYAYSDLGYYHEAVEDFTQAIRLEPDEPSHYRWRGYAYSKLGSKQETIEDYQKAANLYQKQGKNKSYQEILNKLKKLQQ
ncbi:hypothetical protein B4U84_10495 [Westiellopsis prolifica IICB1]|nr:hypothetical protein B4U84_10495 [Westiellopsis prolifica IICB1]